MLKHNDHKLPAKKVIEILEEKVESLSRSIEENQRRMQQAFRYTTFDVRRVYGDIVNLTIARGTLAEIAKDLRQCDRASDVDRRAEFRASIAHIIKKNLTTEDMTERKAIGFALQFVLMLDELDGRTVADIMDINDIVKLNQPY
jgi:hypothetical protein